MSALKKIVSNKPKATFPKTRERYFMDIYAKNFDYTTIVVLPVVYAYSCVPNIHVGIISEQGRHFSKNK